MSEPLVDHREGDVALPDLPCILFDLAAGVPMENLWVVEYSRQHNEFCVLPLFAALGTNLKRFLNQGDTGDWVLLGIFHRQKPCDDHVEWLKSIQKQWGLSALTVDDLLRQISP